MIQRTQHHDTIPRNFGQVLTSEELKNIAEYVACSSSCGDDIPQPQQQMHKIKDDKKEKQEKQKEDTPPADMSDLRKFMSQYLGPPRQKKKMTTPDKKRKMPYKENLQESHPNVEPPMENE